MPANVLVPLLGEGVEEVTITRWLKHVGDSVNELEPLLEVNTDKVDTEIPSPATGVLLSIHKSEGQPARVGELLAVIGVPGEAVISESLSVTSEKPIAKVEAQTSDALPATFNLQPSTPKDLGFISPVVARIAAEHGVNLQEVTGTGLNGRITKNDVLKFIERRQQTTDQRPQTVEMPPIVHHSSSTPAPSHPTPDLSSPDTLLPLTPIRKQIAVHMVESKRTSPHVLTVMEADMSRVIAHRAANKEAFARDGVNLTFTAYFLMAIVAGLKAYPMVNSSWSEQGIVLHKGIHLGMAVSLGEEGLIVPVIKHADGLSLLGMARAVNDLANRARARKLQPDEVRGGTFTLTNHGVSGSLFAFPVINQPQCGILGVGAMQKRVVVETDELGRDSIAIRPMVYLSFVFDHRILDGASADWFLTKVKETLERW
ncbi:MAG: 2-oxo acid dehydrogenase subunit E2 [Anaerolineales bacterium]|nr:2-oxo acid dehydrogenase subunit E2 [Anaerolineales bacterium]MDW8277489.1 dihydrolipoamide acetyltransferase family protein [Anaerolineales bacterium]